MNLHIVNDKKLDWNRVDKVKLKFSSDTLSYEESLRISDLQKLYFVIGSLLQDYYFKDNK